MKSILKNNYNYIFKQVLKGQIVSVAVYPMNSFLKFIFLYKKVEYAYNLIYFVYIRS